MFYIKKDGLIKLFNSSRLKIENTLQFMPEFAELEILETEKAIIERNGEFVFEDDVAGELLLEAKAAKYKEANDGARAYLESGEALYELVLPSPMGEGARGAGEDLPVGENTDEENTASDEELTDESGATLDGDSLAGQSDGSLAGQPSPQPSPGGEGAGWHIEATDGNIGKLSAYALGVITGQLGAGDVVYWNTKEDETIALTQEQLGSALAGLGAVQAEVWNVKFPAYLEMIEACTSADEVRGIVVDYSLPVEVPEESETQELNMPVEDGAESEASEELQNGESLTVEDGEAE